MQRPARPTAGEGLNGLLKPYSAGWVLAAGTATVLCIVAPEVFHSLQSVASSSCQQRKAARPAGSLFLASHLLDILQCPRLTHGGALLQQHAWWWLH